MLPLMTRKLEDIPPMSERELDALESWVWRQLAWQEAPDDIDRAYYLDGAGDA